MRYLFSLVLLLFIGCNSGTSEELIEKRVNAHEAYDQGMSAIGNKNYEEASAKLEAALTAGGLYPDLYDTARANLVVAFAAQGNFDEAQKVLAEFENWHEQKDLLFAAKSFLFAQQGKKSEANRELAKAKRVNRFIQPFTK